MRTFLNRALRAAAVLSLLAAMVPAPNAGAAETPYEINVIGPLTGGGAFVGQTYEKTLRVLEGVVNAQGGVDGHPISFVFLDDQTNAQIAVQLTDGLIAKKSPMLLGSAFESMCDAMDPLIPQGPVVFCLSPGVYTPKDNYLFSASVGSRDLVRAMVRYFGQRGWKRIATLTTTDASGQTADDSFKRYVALPENAGMQIVASEHYAATDLSVDAQIERIKAASPDGILIFTPGAPFATALRAMRDEGLDVPVGTSAANEVTNEMLQYQAFLPKQLYFPGVGYPAHMAQTPAVRRQQVVFEKAMGAAGLPIDLQAGVPWDPALIEIDALRHIGIGATAPQVHAYIEGLKNYAGITGTYNFTVGDQRGIGLDAAVIMTWDRSKGQFVAASGFGGIVQSR